MSLDPFDCVVELERSEVIGVDVGEEEWSMDSSISGRSMMDDEEDEAEIELVTESDR